MNNTTDELRAVGSSTLVRFFAFTFVVTFIGIAAGSVLALPVLVVMLTIADPWGMLDGLELVLGVAIGIAVLAWLWVSAWEVVTSKKSNSSISGETAALSPTTPTQPQP